MLKWLIHRRLRAFEKEYGYDASYMHHVVDTDLGGFMRFARATQMGRYRRDLPSDVFAAVSLVGTVAADCGPCAQLGVTMALREGVSAQTLVRILRNDLAELSEPVRLGVQYARAVIARDGAAADPVREELEKRYGKRGLVQLALALCASQLYPTFKWALGFGHTCSRIDVDGITIAPKAHATLVAA